MKDTSLISVPAKISDASKDTIGIKVFIKKNARWTSPLRAVANENGTYQKTVSWILQNVPKNVKSRFEAAHKLMFSF